MTALHTEKRQNHKIDIYGAVFIAKLQSVNEKNGNILHVWFIPPFQCMMNVWTFSLTDDGDIETSSSTVCKNPSSVRASHTYRIQLPEFCTNSET